MASISGVGGHGGEGGKEEDVEKSTACRGASMADRTRKKQQEGTVLLEYWRVPAVNKGEKGAFARQCSRCLGKRR